MVGTVGNLTPVKNHLLLVEAFAGAVRQGLDAQLQIAGQGPMGHAVRDRATALGMADRVQLVGQVRDVPQFLGQLDLFVLSSASEAHPNALLEAMATGLPCVATAVGGVPEVLREGAGVVVDLDAPRWPRRSPFC